MALIKCPECSNEVSDRAASCPICGCPIDEIKKKFGQEEVSEILASMHDPQENPKTTKQKPTKKTMQLKGLLIALICVVVLATGIISVLLMLKPIIKVDVAQSLPALTSALAKEKTSDADKNNTVTVDYPDTVVCDNGVTVSITDAYVKCKNTKSTTYGYDGLFLFVSCELVSVPDKTDYFAVYADMFDENDRYIGDVQVVYEKCSSGDIGKRFNGNAILSASGVKRVEIKSR